MAAAVDQVGCTLHSSIRGRSRTLLGKVECSREKGRAFLSDFARLRKRWGNQRNAMSANTDSHHKHHRPPPH